MAEKKAPKPVAAPELVVERWIQGKPVTLKSLRGRVVLLHFWLAWPDMESLPIVENAYRRYKSRGLAVISILVPGYDETYVRKIMLQERPQHPIGVSQDPKMWEAYQKISGRLVLIDRKGMATPVTADPQALESSIEKALARN